MVRTGVLEPDVEPELEEALDFDDQDEPEEALDVTEVAELIDPVVELRLEPELEVADVRGSMSLTSSWTSPTRRPRWMSRWPSLRACRRRGSPGAR